MKLEMIGTEARLAKIQNWLRVQHIKNGTIRPDNRTVDVDGDLLLDYFTRASFPYNICFGKVSGDFSCNGAIVNSIQCFPQAVEGDFSCYHTNIKSLSGIDKVVYRIDGAFGCTESVTHLLGLLLIPNIKRFEFGGGLHRTFIIGGKREPLSLIMDKYIGTGDILSAQDELIDAGYVEQARL